MTRVVSVGRSKSLFLAGALGITLLVVSLTGCPGTLSNPNDFPTGAGGSVGAAGTGGPGTAGTGAAGTGAGTAGTGGLPPGCNPDVLFGATGHNCTLAGACHDAMGSAAGFKMTPAGWDQHLVGTLPPGGGATGLTSMCMGKGMPYITKAQPAAGLILNKLTAPTPLCGAHMPSIGNALTTTEIACVQAWANQLAAAAP